MPPGTGMGCGFPGKVKLPKQFLSVKILGVSSRENAGGKLKTHTMAITIPV
jgi:hypothetical protein